MDVSDTDIFTQNHFSVNRVLKIFCETKSNARPWPLCQPVCGLADLFVLQEFYRLEVRTFRAGQVPNTIPTTEHSTSLSTIQSTGMTGGTFRNQAGALLVANFENLFGLPSEKENHSPFT